MVPAQQQVRGFVSSLRVAILLALISGAVVPLDGAAQSVQGRILDHETETPVPLAIVILLGSDESPVAQTLSRDDGSFLLNVPAAGFYRLRVSGLGLADFRSSVFAVGEEEAVTFEVRVQAHPVELDSLFVEVQGNRGRDRFRERVERGLGFFLDRTQLDAIDPVDMVDIFRNVEGVQMSWSFVRHDDGGSRPVPTVRAGPKSCMTYMLDDRPVRGGIGDNRSPLLLFPLSSIRMEDIQAVEVYRDLREVPPELRNSAFRPVWGAHGSYWEDTCGITVFRTKIRW